jgi:aspartyl-tRNA(Asn)/glutamyl-tRNA(Gln) amidotransferase subunit A
MTKFETWKPIAKIAKETSDSTVTATENVKKSLALISELKEYNAILRTLEKRALKRAEEIDSRVKKGEKIGKLAGVPFIAKDNFLSFGAPTTAASHILEPFDAPYQSTAIELLEAEGAILVAKANLDAFAHGSSTENSAFGPTLNPFDKTRVPGGSSGGSAASVALGLAPFALGTDTGGSIRLPASFCGIVGYKPTYGLVSRYGVVAMASSTDVIGPLTRSVKDTSIVLDVMAGRDVRDGTTIERDSESYVVSNTSLKGKKIGIIREYFDKGLDEELKKVIEKQITLAKNAGAEIVDVSIPSIGLALAVYYIIVPAEVSSNLSRYDGQRYGASAKDAVNIDESYELTRERGFEPENKRRIMIGTYVLSSGYYDAYYKKAQTVRTKLINEFGDVFKKVDYLLGPTAPTPAFKLGQNSNDPLAMYLADIMTVAVNLVGIPAVSIPAGMVDDLPVGLQLMAPQKQDKELLELAQSFEEIQK